MVIQKRFIITTQQWCAVYIHQPQVPKLGPEKPHGQENVKSAVHTKARSRQQTSQRVQATQNQLHTLLQQNLENGQSKAEGHCFP